MRRQLPARSPITLSALIHGFAGALGRNHHDDLAGLLRAHFGSSGVVLTDSGTSALALGLQAAARGDGIVAMPAYGCYDLATAAEGAGARVALYDVDPRTLAPESASFARALAYGPKAVVVVHLFGVPVNLEPLRQQVREAGAWLIEDSAQGIGGEQHGAPLGAHGDMTVLSFGRGKGLTGGGGGALLFKDGSLVTGRLEDSGTAGWNELIKAGAQWLLGRPAPFGLLSEMPFLHFGDTVYHTPRTPRPLSRAAERIVRDVWSASRAAAQTRRINAQRLMRVAEASACWQLITPPAGSTPGWLRLPLIAKTDVVATRADLGVMRSYPLPLSALDRFRDRCLLNASDSFPGAEQLAARLITVPTHDMLSERDLTDLERWLTNPSIKH